MGIQTTREKEKKMSEGFNDGKVKVNVNVDEIDIILKKYKKLNKYKKSALFAVKTIDGTESIITSLIKEAQEDPVV
jgi:hypothetical protein